jgi:hypothetical protein
MQQQKSRKRTSDDINSAESSPMNSIEAQDLNPTSKENTSTSSTEEDKKPKVQEDILERIEIQLAQNPTTFTASMVDAAPKKLDSLTREQTNKIIKLFADKSNTTENLAVVGITALVQGGGTNSSMPPITRVVNGQKYELKTLRDCVSFVTEKKGTVRQLAKSMRNIIYKIALQNSWLGPLASALRKEYPESQFDQLELVLAAEFHEDNMEPYMPLKVREALVDRAQKLRAARLQPQKKKNKKKGGKKKQR